MTIYKGWIAIDWDREECRGSRFAGVKRKSKSLFSEVSILMGSVLIFKCVATCKCVLLWLHYEAEGVYQVCVQPQAGYWRTESMKGDSCDSDLVGETGYGPIMKSQYDKSTSYCRQHKAVAPSPAPGHLSLAGMEVWRLLKTPNCPVAGKPPWENTLGSKISFWM